jgi:type II secretory pathway pseudopilin PulG
LTRFQFGLLTLLALLVAAAVAGILTLGSLNRALQSEVNARQQYVQQSVQLETLYREIVRALAELAARNNDSAVRDMLGRHGISYTANPPAAPAGPTSPPRK